MTSSYDSFNLRQKFYNLKNFYKYSNSTLCLKIIFIGAGGTGGYLIPPVIRLISNIKNSFNSVEILIVDPDTVEMKNINRQNFILTDIGRNKAEVFASRYSSLFDIPVDYLPEKFISFDNIIQKNTNFSGVVRNTFYLIIDTIDNINGRVQIHDAIYSLINSSVLNSVSDRLVWISVGNGEDFGQVSIFDTIAVGKEYGSYFSFNYEERKNPFFYMPYTPPELFPNNYSETALQNELEELNRISCGDIVVSRPQTLLINYLGATLALIPIYYHLTSNLSEPFQWYYYYYDNHGNSYFSKYGESINKVNDQISDNDLLESL